MKVGDLVRSTWRIDTVTGKAMCGIIVDMIPKVAGHRGWMTKTPVILWDQLSCQPDRVEYLEVINECG